ncbi:TatD family hydrolase [Lederbergia citrea]|uniref:TatD family hydrolase n=1 Tax=Lederbergia citrea TaxID=2833581 RepID=UPI001BC8FCC5|nr:TatD family hydrolase [Lederbergia citrea]MBS4205340.1 TatD family hydrolase [Lederbergia citrea]
MRQIIDAHIHLDHYQDNEIELMMKGLNRIQCTNIISVSFDLASCKRNIELANQYLQVKPAFGFHPEQELPSDSDVGELISWIEKNKDKMIAIGEVGLPYYLRTESRSFRLEGYIELLESFLKLAKRWEKPIVLHAVYDDAPVVCDLLEKYNIKNAHFHWFKGNVATIERMIKNGYYISVTPDVLYEQEIQELVKIYPIEKMMVETDGPWPFEGIFSGKMTHPWMIHQSINAISELKKEEVTSIYETLYNNTKYFYGI